MTEPGTRMLYHIVSFSLALCWIALVYFVLDKKQRIHEAVKFLVCGAGLLLVWIVVRLFWEKFLY